MKHRVSSRFFWILLLAWMCFVPATHAQITQNSTLALGDIDKNIPSSSHPKIVVFLPGLTEKTEYASMIVQGFKNYFVDKLAFRSQDRKNADIDIILVTQDQQKPAAALPSKEMSDFQRPWGTAFYFDTRGMRVISGIGNALRQSLELPALEGNNDDAVLFLLDGNNHIVMRDDHYRAQGEHLKPLEYRVKKLLNLPIPEVAGASGKMPTVGQLAPNIPLNAGKTLANYRGKVLVVSFYPAAFSGVLDTLSLNLARQRETMRSQMSCAVQIRSLNNLDLSAPVFALSESTPELLARWQDILVTHDIQYINDPNYAAAQAYGAYDEQQGYNKRVTAVIDQQGRIAYLNADYRLDQEAQIRSIVEKLSASSHSSSAP